MCFEFEWLYWAQMAQQKSRHEDESTPARQAQEGSKRPADRDIREEEQRSSHQPAHA